MGPRVDGDGVGWSGRTPPPTDSRPRRGWYSSRDVAGVPRHSMEVSTVPEGTSTGTPKTPPVEEVPGTLVETRLTH